MKAAVISLAPTYGKTCLMSVLAGVYSRSQKKTAVIMSTGNALDNLDIISSEIRNDAVANPYVFKSMIEAAENGDRELLNYGVRQGSENVFVFNILGSAMSQDDKEEFFLTAMKKLPADLMLIEMCRNPLSEFNQQVLKEVDCVLCLVDQSSVSFRKLEEIRRVLNFAKEGLSDNVAYVISRYNPDVCSDKKITAMTGIKTASMFKFGYNPAIQKLALNSELDTIAYDIIIGDFNVVALRVQMLEIMQYLFDTSTRKIIRSIDKWYR